MHSLLIILLFAQMPTAVIEGPRSADATMAIAPAVPTDYGSGPWPLRVAWDSVPNVNGYVLYLGPTAGNYTQRIVVGTPTSFIAYPGPGTWHVAVSAYREAFGVIPPPQPVDCQLSAWAMSTADAWSLCVSGTQTRLETWERAVVVAPQNGGLACGALTETLTCTQACVPSPSCGPDAVRIAVGNWSRTLAPGNVGTVSYSLLGSRNPVTTVIVKFDGVEQDRVTGSDLRKVASSYFQSPVTRGSYSLSVEAQDAAGCSDGASRPMTVVVQ